MGEWRNQIRVRKNMRKILLAFGIAVVILFLIFLAIGLTGMGDRNSYTINMIKDRSEMYFVVRTLKAASREESSGTDEWLLWPKSDTLEKTGCTNSTIFFSRFFDSTQFRYPSGYIFDADGKSKWSILMDVSEMTDENIPALVSGRISLPLSVRANLSEVFFICTKDYSFEVVPSDPLGKIDVCLAVENECDRIRFLTPTGVVDVVFTEQ